MAWLIVRIYNDRQRQHLVQIVKKPAKYGAPEATDITELAKLCEIEIHSGATTPPRKEWPWSAVAYTCRSRDGIGRPIGAAHLVARPKTKGAKP